MTFGAFLIFHFMNEIETHKNTPQFQILGTLKMAYNPVNPIK